MCLYKFHFVSIKRFRRKIIQNPDLEQDANQQSLGSGSRSELFWDPLHRQRVFTRVHKIKTSGFFVYFLHDRLYLLFLSQFSTKGKLTNSSQDLHSLTPPPLSVKTELHKFNLHGKISDCHAQCKDYHSRHIIIIIMYEVGSYLIISRLQEH